MKLYDQNGDECQMTGLPHMFYDKVAVIDLMQRHEARIAELEKQLRGANATIALFLGPDGEQHVEKFMQSIKSLTL